MTDTAARTGYASVNGIEMYYEIHGAGPPLVLLHGAFMTIDGFGDLLPGLAQTRQVIAIEQQAHGHTGDIDRPLTYEQMADDTAALLRQIGVANADVYGYSMGGGIALQLALRHSELVRKLVLASISYTSEGMYPEVLATIATLTPDVFIGTPFHDAYVRVAPNPDDFPNLVAKIKQLDATDYAWPAAEIAALTAPTLVIVGDSDGIKPEHAVDLFRLRGGGVFGDIAGLPPAQLAVFPGTTHIGVMVRTDLLLAVVPPFLDAPMPEGR
jgi:pimeloyl-ACP methyl ester carboxylesterase